MNGGLVAGHFQQFYFVYYATERQVAATCFARFCSTADWPYWFWMFWIGLKVLQTEASRDFGSETSEIRGRLSARLNLAQLLMPRNTSHQGSC